MSGANAPGKTSSDSGQHAALDRWSQRRLQRLNTEQGFREQRQGGGQNALGPSQSNDTSTGYNSNVNTQYPPSDAQGVSHVYSPHPSHQSTFSTSRSSSANQQPSGLAIQPQSNMNSSRSPGNQSHDSPNPYAQPHYQQSPRDSTSHQDSSRPNITQSRSISYQGANSDDSQSAGNNGNMTASKQGRSTNSNANSNSNRQSVHNGMTRDNSQPGVPTYNYSSNNQGHSQQKADVGRATPQPLQIGGEDMNPEDVVQLIKDHRELREKYTKVKKYYFEKEDQVKQLQNSLAHQRLSQSRTSLDDSEYTTRFNRLDGLIAQLAFSIRKNWRSIPTWLAGSVNKDAMTTRKQEMTAVGRAFISAWLVEEVFDKYFHPDLEPSLSAQLKSIQKNIRRYAPVVQSAEEDEVLTSKVVNWRMATLEGLQEAMRSPQCPANRQKLTDVLKDNLIAAVAAHLEDPPPSDLEGGVHMIIELVVSIAIHLPLESRYIQIDYFQPGYGIVQDQMKFESGIPPLGTSIAEENAERGSMKSATSDATDTTETASVAEQPSKKRGMLSAFTGSGGGGKSKAASQAKHAGSGGSSSSLPRPESAQGAKDDAPPRVRMAAGIGVQVRGRAVLVKAPVFST